MEKSILKVDGMSCSHCVKAVTDAVSALHGVENVLANLEDKTVTVVYDSVKCSLEKIKDIIDDRGYGVSE